MSGVGAGRDAPVITIAGAAVALGPAGRELVPLIQRWINDFSTQRTLGGLPAPQTREQVAAIHERIGGAADGAVFAIYERASGRPIGIGELQAIDLRHRTAELVLFIGEPAARGRGFGSEVTRLMLDYAFATLGLHNVMLRVYEYNLAGRRAYAKAGFREFARLRQSHLLGGRRWDTILMECLAGEAGAERATRGGGDA